MRRVKCGAMADSPISLCSHFTRFLAGAALGAGNSFVSQVLFLAPGPVLASKEHPWEIIHPPQALG